MGVVGGLDEETCAGAARDDGWTRGTAFEQRFARVDAEATAAGAGVALVAVVGEDGADAGFEELFGEGVLTPEGLDAAEGDDEGDDEGEKEFHDGGLT